MAKQQTFFSPPKQIKGRREGPNLALRSIVSRHKVAQVVNPLPVGFWIPLQAFSWDVLAVLHNAFSHAWLGFHVRLVEVAPRIGQAKILEKKKNLIYTFALLQPHTPPFFSEKYNWCSVNPFRGPIHAIWMNMSLFWTLLQFSAVTFPTCLFQTCCAFISPKTSSYSTGESHHGIVCFLHPLWSPSLSSGFILILLTGSCRDSVWESQREQRLVGFLTLKEEPRLQFIKGKRVELVKPANRVSDFSRFFFVKRKLQQNIDKCNIAACIYTCSVIQQSTLYFIFSYRAVGRGGGLLKHNFTIYMFGNVKMSSRPALFYTHCCQWGKTCTCISLNLCTPSHFFSWVVAIFIF